MNRLGPRRAVQILLKKIDSSFDLKYGAKDRVIRVIDSVDFRFAFPNISDSLVFVFQEDNIFYYATFYTFKLLFAIFLD